jgi:hypothetical protein
MLRGRFNLHFLDTLLILIWLFILGLGLLGLVFTVAPSIQRISGAFITAESAFIVSAYAFLVLSTARFIQQWGFSASIMLPVSYILCHGAMAILISSTVLKKPMANNWVGNIVPACVVAFFLIPLIKIWDRIKPVSRKKWVPPPAITRARQEQQKDDAIRPVSLT